MSPSSPQVIKQEPRFTPGQTLLGRYRIISVLGQGGMGEVYRADDLRLRQQVALKFLPQGFLDDADRLARLQQEVRIARQVSNPMVCRVHDIAELEGQTFLTMEFIDGEDLRSLLKRIGRLPEDKGIEIASQLCEGLSAVHQQGIVHRDLKPGNIMIDGRGRVRLTDFGLAVFADAVPASDFHSGTPAYMAPEQLSGAVPTVHSDLFALGLVLYEVFTGRRAYPATSQEELARLYESHRPASITDLVPGIDPRVVKVIRQCLEKDPAQRPKSALEVAASLPKRDPLETALAQGRTPSPEVVANAGAEGSLAPPVATGLLLACLLGIVLVAVLAGQATVCGLFPVERPPDALAARARTLLDRLDSTNLPADQRYGFYYDYDYFDYVIKSDASAGRWTPLDRGRSPGVGFWFRQSPAYLVATGMGPRKYPGRVTFTDPTPVQPGSASVLLGADGRLLELARVPGRERSEAAPTNAVNFKSLFEEAKLDWSTARQVPPKWTPPSFADQLLAWEAARSDQPDDFSRVEAATNNGQVIYFKVYQGEWDRPDSPHAALQPEPRPFQYIYAGFFSLVVLGAAWLARRNLRLGLGDARGAWRLAVFLFVSNLLCMMLVADHVPSFRDEAAWLMKALGFAALWSGLCWLLYFALEPYVRRRWPWRMISWNRLLAGRVFDPMVGRDILIGALLGIFLTLIHQLGVILPPLFGHPAPIPLTTWLSAFTNVPFHLLMELPAAVRDALQWYFLLFLLVLFVRIEWLAGLLIFSFAEVYYLIQEPEFQLSWALLMGAVVIASLFVALRFGLLAVTSGLFFCYFLYQVPLTIHFSVWYGWPALVYLLWPMLLVGIAFFIARGGQPSFREFS